jgi:hypothetical protein
MTAQNVENTNYGTMPAFTDKVVYTLLIFGQLNQKEKQEFMCQLFDQRVLTCAPPQDIADMLNQRASTREAEAKKRAAEQETRRKAYDTPDYKFPHLFSTNPLGCLEYIQKLDATELTKLHSDIKGNPMHFSSILDNRPADAIAMLENEVTRRAVEKQPNRFVETLKKVLNVNTEKKPIEAPKDQYTT